MYYNGSCAFALELARGRVDRCFELRVLALAAVFAGAACGVAPNLDASTSTDASAQDAGPSCEQYCACVMNHCSSQLPTGRSCPDFCNSFGASTRACRYDQCVLVMRNAALAGTHCPEVVGMGGICM
jgi:hypothetical protein